MKKSLLATFAAASLLLAADPAPGTFKQHIELGYIGTSGNSDSQTFSGLYSHTYQWTEQTDSLFRADAHYGEQDGEKNAERYRAHLLVNHHYSERWYSYAEAGALRNVFDGYEQQYNGGAGMGYIFIKNDKQLFKGRAGYQYRYANLTTGTDEDNHYFKLGLNHEYHFTEKTGVVSELNFLEDLEESDNYETVFRIALKTALIDNFSLKIGFEVKYDNTPVEGKDNTDTTSKVAIVYDF
ncbi:MAG: DUF481 domain-containing protein [Epsilonproteobacteria bacterium]|nr:DUF481 domain-containing protein [Campylobacterota bacterium]